MEFIRAPRVPHFTALAITRNVLPRFDSWYAYSGSVITSGCNMASDNNSSTGVVASALFCSDVNAAIRCPD